MPIATASLAIVATPIFDVVPKRINPASLEAVARRRLQDAFLAAYDRLCARVPKLGPKAAYAKQAIRDKLMEHKQYIARYGDDVPEITGLEVGARGRGVHERALDGGRQRLGRGPFPDSR